MKTAIRYILTLIYGVYLRKKDVFISPNCIISIHTHFEGRNKINSKSNITNSKIGKGTYLGDNNYLVNVVIGKFCSIGSNVKVISATHPTKTYVTSHPAFFSVLKQAGFTFVNRQKFEELIFFDKKNHISLKIGNDVWIGDDVKIIGGLEIGNGAVIATGAVVTRNVLPYSIVGGVPAKHIKFKFKEDIINFLQDFKWWEKDDQWLISNSSKFSNIELFCEEFKK